MTPILTHIALHVRDIDACVKFYRDYCGMTSVHTRTDPHGKVVWLAEPGKEQSFVIVLLTGGSDRVQDEGDYDHLGFAVDSEDAVEDLARRGDAAGCLVWPPRREPYPVGYYCALRDPDGNVVEFSYGQPLGPGAEDLR